MRGPLFEVWGLCSAFRWVWVFSFFDALLLHTTVDSCVDKRKLTGKIKVLCLLISRPQRPRGRKRSLRRRRPLAARLGQVSLHPALPLHLNGSPHLPQRHEALHGRSFLQERIEARRAQVPGSLSHKYGIHSPNQFRRYVTGRSTSIPARAPNCAFLEKKGNFELSV